MTNWGYLLLFLYVGLGLSRLPWRKAGSVAVVATLFVFVYVFASYGAVR
jgi:hypothetical protein